jgi:hypothetical protein
MLRKVYKKVKMEKREEELVERCSLQFAAIPPPVF